MPEPTSSPHGEPGEGLTVPPECLTPQERLRLAAELYLKAIRRHLADAPVEPPASTDDKPPRPDEVA